jgi:benzoate/toluate 1,2-dioxygenase alpha subunit
MVKGSRNLCLYPNVYLMDQFQTQIRHFRPIAPDKTEVTIYCIAPKGESAAARAHRIRQYEDFFNASGMATPDDLEEFRSCQLTFRASAAPWNDMSRGAEHWLTGPDDVAQSLACTASSPRASRTRTRASTPCSTATGCRPCGRAGREHSQQDELT